MNKLLIWLYKLVLNTPIRMMGIWGLPMTVEMEQILAQVLKHLPNW